MKETLRLYAYLIIDAHGNRCTIAVDNLETIVLVDSIRNKEDTAYLHFESDARHLKNWAEMNGLQFYSTEQDVEFLLHISFSE